MILIKKILRKIATSLALTAGLLAVSSMRSTMKEPTLSQIASRPFESVQSGSSLAIHLGSASNSDVLEDKTVQAFQDSLAQDELLEINPYKNLSSSEPLYMIYKQGVKSFERQTYRSANYVEEFGYDLIQYGITHQDSTRSTILAFVESRKGSTAIAETHALSAHSSLSDQDSLSSQSSIEPTRSASWGEKASVLWIFIPNQHGQDFYNFRSGVLIERRSLSQEESERMVQYQLSSSLPFFSVAR